MPGGFIGNSLGTKRGSGCVLFLALVAVSAIVLFLIFNTANSPFAQGSRALQRGDSARAIRLFESEALAGGPRGARAIESLCGISDPRSLESMINLLDIPDSRSIDPQVREQLALSIKSRTRDLGTPPAYDPSGSVTLRQAQKRDWQNWFHRVR